MLCQQCMPWLTRSASCSCPFHTSPGDSNLSNTPAVFFTLHANNTAATDVNITFMVAQGFGLRSGFSQLLDTPAATPVPTAASRSDCSAACGSNADCLAWDWSGVPSSPKTTGIGVTSYTNLGNGDWQAGAMLRDGNTAPKLAAVADCEAACTAIAACTTGLYVNGTVRHGECWLSSGTAPRPRTDFCGAAAGQSCAGFRKTGAPMPPPPPRCKIASASSGGTTARYPLGANRAGTDSGTPGTWSVVAKQSVTFTTKVHPIAQQFNGLGAQTLQFPDGGVCAGCTSGVGVGDSIEDLLEVLRSGEGLSGEAGASLSGGGNATSGMLFAAASVTAVAVAPGSSVAMSVAHAWHFPRDFWFRDSHSGSDIGVRYSNTYPSIGTIVPSLNVSTVANNLLAWQRVYSGLPHPVLQDAAFNLFNHMRSAAWPADGGCVCSPTRTYPPCYGMFAADIVCVQICKICRPLLQVPSVGEL